MTKKHQTKKTMRISEFGEFSLIKRIQNKCADTSPEILKGIGDDAAAVSGIAGKTNTTLITSDMMLEGIHFDLSFTTFYQLGYKILAVNISDIFAMGATPKYFLLSLGIPGTYDPGNINELYSGVMKIAGKFRVAVIGGDICESSHRLVLSGTLIGYADEIITRSGARRGDGIFVTDSLGDSAMGLMLLKKLGRRVPIEMQNEKCKMKNADLKIHDKKLASRDVLPLIKKHLMPDPAPLKETSGITSMIDVSDGLIMDLSHICDESKVGALIYKDKLPVSRELANAAKNFGVDPFKFTLNGGEDYVLLFTARQDTKIKNALRIGEIIKKGRFVVGAKGEKTPFKAEGYEHFKNTNTKF